MYLTSHTLIFIFAICLHNAICVEEADPIEDTNTFFDMEMGKDRSLKNFYYKGGYLSIYEGRNEKLKRYYVTPLTELESMSARCFPPGIENRHKVRFNMTLWNVEVVDEAVKELAEPPLNLEVRKEHVHPLPMLKVRLSVHRISTGGAYEPDTVWKSNLNQRMQQTFSIYAANKEKCEGMVTEIKEEPEAFASLIQLEIAMSAEKRASLEISVTGKNIGRSKMFSELQNMDQTNGVRLLTSSDLNHLAQEIISSIVASEITTGDWVEQKDQINFAQLLEHQLASTDIINAKQLTIDQWKSVFWQEEFVRPDRYTSYLNRFMNYDKGAENFSFSNETEFAAFKHTASDMKRDSSSSNSWSAQAQVSILGFGIGGGGGSSNSGSQSNQDKKEMDVDDKGRVTMSMDQMQSFLNKRDLQVEWNGEVFVSKSLNLHRINTAELQSMTTIATQQIRVQTIPITVKLDATVASYSETDSLGKDHIRILIDQAKNEIHEDLVRINTSIHNSLALVEEKLQSLNGEFSDQKTNVQQLKQENQEMRNNFLETKQFEQAKQELLQQMDAGFSRSIQEINQKTTELQGKIEIQTTEIDQIRVSINSLQHPPAVQCQTYHTDCTLESSNSGNLIGVQVQETELNVDRHNVKCAGREEYMTEFAVVQCKPSNFDPFLFSKPHIQYRTVCCK